MSAKRRIEISRGRFIGMGASVLLLSSATAISPPLVAKARTLSFNVATTTVKITDPPYNCRGDGSDETDKINQCLAENRYVEIPEPPAGVGYGVNAGGLKMPSGLELSGQGVNSKLLRVGAFRLGAKSLKNADFVNGDSFIKLNNLYIEGFRSKPDVPNVDSDSDTTGIAIRANDPDKRCTNIEFTGVEVHNWPGVSMRVINGSGITYTDVKSFNPSRGGIIFNATSDNLSLLRVTSADSGDDAIAFLSTGGTVSGVTMDFCESYTRPNPEFGSALKFGGTRGALVTNSSFKGAKNSQVYITSFPGGFHPRDVTVNDCTISGGQKHSYQIEAYKATLISARRNRMEEPAQDCVNIKSPDGSARTFDVTVTENTLVRPGNKHINVQTNLTGVNTGGNTLIYSDTTPPTITDLNPAPNSTITGRLRQITATITDTATRRENDLRKKNIKLYLNGNRITNFDYYTSGKLIYNDPAVVRGKNTVKIVATDIAGNVARKEWSFTMK